MRSEADVCRAGLGVSRTCGQDGLGVRTRMALAAPGSLALVGCPLPRCVNRCCVLPDPLSRLARGLTDK